MKKSFAPVFALAFALILSGVALANPGSSANQTVGFEVDPIHAIAVSGDPAPLVINSASAGSEPDDAIDSSTTYSFTTNYIDSHILASLDSAMPPGVMLFVRMATPEGLIFSPYVALNGSDQTVVYDLNAGAASGLGIWYMLHAPAEAGFNGVSSRTVTFTLMGGI